MVARLVHSMKGSPGCFQIISDLSWPQGHSVNDFTSSEQYSLIYMSIDKVVQMIQPHSPGILLSKLDFANAFYHIVVQPSQWRWLVYSRYHVNANNETMNEYYLSIVLPFGLHSSPARCHRLNMFYKSSSSKEVLQSVNTIWVITSPWYHSTNM